MARRPLPTFEGPNLTGELQLHFIPGGVVRRDLHVARVETVTPALRRIVLAGDALGDYPWARFSPGDHVKAYFPGADGRITAYAIDAEGEWHVDGDGEPQSRDYTPRAFDAAANELTLEFVLHGTGVASSWATAAAAGDALTLFGPSANWLIPEDYPHYLAAGDETAIPAIARIVEEAPVGAHVTTVIEVSSAAEMQDLRPGEGVTLDAHWVLRDAEQPAEGHVSALETRLRTLGLPARPEDVYAFAGGEAGAMKPIRRWLRRELGLPKRQVQVDGYWRRGQADFDHHETGVEQD